LKRSSAIDGNHPNHIRLLEVLNIFAVRANYMVQFRDYLEREGVEVEGEIELPLLKIKPNKEFLSKGLIVPRIPEGRSFEEECDIVLGKDKAAKVKVDMSLKIQSMLSGPDGFVTQKALAGKDKPLAKETLELVDWEAIYLELLQYKESKGYFNFAIPRESLREIIESSEPCFYELVADESVFDPKSFSQIALLEEAVLSILRKYVDKFYKVEQQRWDSDNMAYQKLEIKDPNFQDYVIKIPRSQEELIEAVKKLIEEGDRIYKEERLKLPTIYFDRHLYQPLIIEKGDDLIKSSPKALEESEQRFVADLKEFVTQELGKSLASKEVFLLRNLSRGKGIGFFEREGFYPDFILWIKNGKQQKIIFVDPHGMRQEKTESDKTQLHLKLKELSAKWGKKAGMKNVELDSFIISVTKYDDLVEIWHDTTWKKEDFAKAHILFFEGGSDYDYVPKLFE
jgi:hypothetical protein